MALRTRYALCVIGAGPAGIITAIEFSRRCPGKKILLVDYGTSGEREKNSLDETIEVRNSANHHDPYECTNKGLGGSSATWGGRCVMYDRGDFIPRSVIGDTCTWDASFFDECAQFIPTAQEYFESGRGAFDLSVEGLSVKPLAEGFQSSRVTDTVLERWSMPTRFGHRYQEFLERSTVIHLLLGFEARELPVPTAAGVLNGVAFRNVEDDSSLSVHADFIVLAAGAQETTRLLLRNKRIFSKLSSPPASLGKFYQGHISGKIASIRFSGRPEATEFGFRREQDGTYQRRRFQFTEKTLVAENLINTAFWLDNPPYVDPSHRSGAMSFMYLAMITPWLGRKLAPPTIAHSITKGKVNQVSAHLWNVLKDLPGSLWTPASIFIRRYLRKRKLPGVFLYSAENRYALHFHAEQIPVEANRMTIAADSETLVIDYSVTAADAQAVVRAHEVLDAELRQSGCGELEYWFRPEERVAAIQAMSKDGVHQSGTTRIADAPERGVVNRDLRVWGTENLYICSSSVFPTSGQANPTFFMGVCAVRLARYLSTHAHS